MEARVTRDSEVNADAERGDNVQMLIEREICSATTTAAQSELNPWLAALVSICDIHGFAVSSAYSSECQWFAMRSTCSSNKLNSSHQKVRAWYGSSHPPVPHTPIATRQLAADICDVCEHQASKLGR